MASLPLQRSKAYLEKQGWNVWIVEKWIAWPKPGHRLDLFNMWDLLCLRADSQGVMGIQCCASDVAEHIQKLVANPLLSVWFASGNKGYVHGWSKKCSDGRGSRKVWTIREVVPTPPMTINSLPKAKEADVSDIFHHKIHTGAPLPNTCPECDLSLAWSERDALRKESEALRQQLEQVKHKLEFEKRESENWHNETRIALTELLALRTLADKMAEAIDDLLHHGCDIGPEPFIADPENAKDALAAYRQFCEDK